MTTILTTRTAHWDICRHRRFERNDRQIKTAGGTELQGQLQARDRSETIKYDAFSTFFDTMRMVSSCVRQCTLQIYLPAVWVLRQNNIKVCSIDMFLEKA
jgi:hypothetical protein